MKLNPLQCFLIVACFMLIGEIISNKTKAFIPSVFVTAILFLMGFWTFVPKDVVTQASFGPQFVSICISLLLVHLGTIMSLRKLIEQWKAVVVAVGGVCGIILFTMTIGRLFFDWHTVVAAVPPLTGGVVSALLMSEGLKAKGLTALVALPTTMFITHSFFGYDWTLPFVPGSTARAVSPQEAILLAADNNVPISYDTTAQAPHFDYTASDGKRHTVWFEDARSIQAKFNLIKELGLRGISYWKLGISFPQNWLLIENNFNVVKR